MNMKKTRTIREPGLRIGLTGDAITGDSRLSAMNAVTQSGGAGEPETLEGSVRGAKPDASDILPDVVSKTARPGQPRSRVVRQVLNEARRG